MLTSEPTRTVRAGSSLMFFCRPRPRVDRLLVGALSIYGVLVLAAQVVVLLRSLFAEDAVILHQYSRNLALHGAITYYAGGPHAEGATEFGWMLLLAAAMRLGVSPVIFTAFANVASLLLLPFVLLRIAGRRPSWILVCAIAGTAGLVPQILAALSGFATLPEALLLALLTLTVLETRVRLASTVALLLCLLRPDSVVFAVPLLLSLIVARENRQRRLALILCLFVLPGMAYFCLRWWYFGQLFPLPFLVKADVHRRLGLVVPHSVSQSMKYLLLDALLLCTVWKRLRLRPALVVSLLAMPTLFYWSMRLDQNVGDRFFFYLPLAAALCLASGWRNLLERDKKLLLRCGTCAFAVLLLGPLLREVRSFRDFQFRSVHAMASALHTAPVRGSMLTSEAGYLAYDSGWIATDPWGLNTVRFAKHLVQPGDVAAMHPDLIALHPDVAGDCLVSNVWSGPYADRTWEHMIQNVAAGAEETHVYDLWYLPYGSHFYQQRKHYHAGMGDQECFFLNTTSPDYRFMVSRLQQQGATLVLRAPTALQ